MIIIWEKWRVKSYKYGYEIQKRLKSRWKTVEWHADLQSACKGLFELRVRTETTNITINTLDKASARLSTAKLIKKSEGIADEILGAINSDEGK